MVPLARTSRTTQLLVSAMYMLPFESKASAFGLLSFAFVAGPPSPEYDGYPQPVPSPTTVEMMPLGSTFRIAQLPVSAMNRFPCESSVTPLGLLTKALNDCPPSPLYPEPIALCPANV